MRQGEMYLYIYISRHIYIFYIYTGLSQKIRIL